VRFISSILFIASLVATPTVVLATQANVPAASWYASTVTAFVDAGYFNDVQSFRPTEPATRGEFVELVVKMMGGLTHAPYSGQSFDDVSLNSPVYGYFEEAALAGWVKGTNGCYGTHPCLAKPDSPINRAEAASLLNRGFGLQAKDKAPTFQDNSPGQWFANDIRTAASLCILKGDAGGKKVRPSDSMNRAEMVVMLERLKEDMSYPSCTSDKGLSLPKAPVNQPAILQQSNDRPSPVSSSAGGILITPDGASASSASSSPSSSLSANSCWTCSSWGPCTMSWDIPSHSNVASQTRTCTSSCSTVGFSPPATSQQCSFFDLMPKQMKDNLDKWDALHKEMTEAAKALIPQGTAGKVGIDRINTVEASFIQQYNSYVSIYNEIRSLSPDQKAVWHSRQEEITSIESAMKQIETDFRAIPTVWY
jgi:S-layer homology domain